MVLINLDLSCRAVWSAFRFHKLIPELSMAGPVTWPRYKSWPCEVLGSGARSSSLIQILEAFSKVVCGVENERVALLELRKQAEFFQTQ